GRHLPWPEAFAPRGILAADHVRVTVGEHGRQRRILDALADEEGAAVRRGIGVDAAFEPQAPERIAHLDLEVLAEARGTLGILAFGRDGDAPAEVLEKASVVEIALDGADGVFAGRHGMPAEFAGSMDDPVCHRLRFATRQRA